MKKLIVVFCLFMILPILTNAKSINLSDYTVTSLEEALKEEEISYDFSNYQENDQQITIYLFRGKNCGFCRKFLTYVASTLIPNYGNKFKVITFEVWNHSDNSELFDQTAEFLGDKADGVPYIIIGDQTFNGYAEDMNSSITAAIDKLYASSDRYDVFEEMGKVKNPSSNTVTIVLWCLSFTILSTGILLYKNHQLEVQLEELKSLIKKNKN